jgi:hypothetical protein
MSNDAMTKEVPVTNAQAGMRNDADLTAAVPGAARISGCELRLFAKVQRRSQFEILHCA